jgi:adenine deaminase
MQGGLVVVEDGEVLAAVSLPVAGLISDGTVEAVAKQMEETEAAVRSLGCTLPAPFMTLSFIPLIGLPETGLTEHGLFESVSRKPLSLVVR